MRISLVCGVYFPMTKKTKNLSAKHEGRQAVGPGLSLSPEPFSVCTIEVRHDTKQCASCAKLDSNGQQWKHLKHKTDQLLKCHCC